MCRTLLTAALLAALVPSAFGGGPVGQPSGPPPQVMILTVEREGVQYITQTVMKYALEQRKETLKQGDKLVERIVTVKVPVMVQQRVALDGKDVQVFDHTGKRLAAKDIPRLLKSVPVLVSADGKPVDPFYLRLLREGSLIVVAPALASSPVGPVPPAVPVPLPPPKALPGAN